MKKRYIQPVAGMVYCKSDVVLTSVIGYDNVDDWNEKWLISGIWEK